MDSSTSRRAGSDSDPHGISRMIRDRKVRTLLVAVLGMAALAIGFVIWISTTPVLKPAEDIVVNIPLGTAERIAAGEEVDVIPTHFILVEGDTLILVNEDVESHLVGGYFVWEESELRARFARTGTQTYICSVHPDGQTVFEVSEKPSVWPLVGTELGLAGVTVMLMGLSAGGLGSTRPAVFSGLGVALMLAGLFTAVLTSGVVQTSDIFHSRNSDTTERFASGETTYMRYCSSCHGDGGNGDGDLAQRLGVAPADLAHSVPTRTDLELIAIVADGIPGTIMSGFGDTLTESQVSDLVEYLRTTNE